MLKPPVNVRDVQPACCAFCRSMVSRQDEGNPKSTRPVCIRDPEEVEAAFDGETIYTTICDRFRR